jgi:hypothetical protein
VVEFYLKLKLILRIISYLTYICWEIDNFVIKSDIFRRLFNCKNINLKKLSCYHDNYFRYFILGKYNGFVSKARVSACMYFLVYIYTLYLRLATINISTDEYTTSAKRKILRTRKYNMTRKYMHAETLALLTKPLYFPNMKYLK